MDSGGAHEGGNENDVDGNETPLDLLAKDAADLFKGHKLDECLARLYEIKKRKADDPKVLHNIGVAEYYRDGCVNAEKLLNTLSTLKARTEALARSAEEHLAGDGASTTSAGSATTAGSSSTTILGSTPESTANVTLGSSGPDGGSGTAPTYVEDSDTTIASVNIGILLLRMQQYAAAQGQLEPLYRNIEPIDEAAALRVCFLIMETALSSRQSDKAAAVLSYVEKAFGYLLASGDNGSAAATGTGGQQPSSAPTPGTPTPELAKPSVTPTQTDGGTTAGAGGAEEELGRESLEEGLEEEALRLSLELPDSKRAAELGPGNSSSGTGALLSSSPPRSKPPPALPPELKLLLHLYKARLLLLTRNLKATKREVKAALSMSKDHAQGLLLKAQLEYQRANYRKAIRLLTASSSQSDPTAAAMVLSNLGCIHQRLGKHHTAALYFCKALDRIAPLTTQAQKGATSPASAGASGSAASLALPLLYNTGLQQLLHGNPVLAARCFQKAGALYFNRPLLWLRLAECCLVAYEKGLVGSNPVQWNGLKEDGVMLAVAGGGRWRRVVLQPGGLHASCKSLGINLLEEGHESEGLSKPGATASTGMRGVSDAVQTTAEAQGVAGLDTDTLLAPGISAEPSLEYARRCLQNGLLLLDRQETAAAAEAAGEGSSGEPGGSSGAAADSGGRPAAAESQQKGGGASAPGGSGASGSPGSPAGPSGSREGKDVKGAGGSSLEAATTASLEAEKAQQQSILRPWALASLAYTELCLANPLAALGVANELLALPDCPPPYSFLAHTYAAEALCWLDRPTEAAEHLSTCMVEHTSGELSSVGLRDEDGQKWRSGDHSEASGDGEDGGAAGAGPTAVGRPNLAELTGPSARASLYVNLAAVYAMQGEVLQAQQCALQALSIAPASPLPMLAVVYVELCRGRTQDALVMLKHCRHVRVARTRTSFHSVAHKG